MGGGGSLAGMTFHTKYRFQIHDGFLPTQVHLIFQRGVSLQCLIHSQDPHAQFEMSLPVFWK